MTKRPLNESAEPIFSMTFEDGSRFILPKPWEDVFVDYFGPDAEVYAEVADRLHFVVGKYVAHRAWPSKFDGIGLEEELGDDSKYDHPDFYWEHWDDWRETELEWGGRSIHTPTWADVAEAVLYYHMRSGILQKVLNEVAKKEGVNPIRVVTPEQLLKELEHHKEEQ